MRHKAVLLSFVLVIAPLLGSAVASERWLHVKVEERRADGEQVNVNIPLQLVEAILPAIESSELRHGKIDWDRPAVEGIDLREILQALRDAPDADYVTLKSPQKSVRVAKESGFLVVLVDEEDGERVRVRLPLDVVEALLGSDEDDLDLIAAMRALGEYDGGDLVTVESDDESVRIWIDSRESGE